MTRALIAAIALPVLCGPALAFDQWNVVEGPKGTVRGNWQVEVRFGKLTGNATMTSQSGKIITYAISGEVIGDEFLAHRVSPSDGVGCTYRGRRSGDAIASGVAVCNGVPNGWIVTGKR